MNKKMKKIIATVSAVAMCATSIISLSAGALGVYVDGNNNVTQDTISFYSSGIKYTFWQAGTDFWGNPNLRVYISEPFKITNEFGEEKIIQDTVDLFSYMIGSNGNECIFNDLLIGLKSANGYSHFSSRKGDVNDGKIPLIEEYLKEKSISYTITNNGANTTCISFNTDNMTVDEIAELATDIRKSVDWSFKDTLHPISAGVIEVTNVENALPEPTLLGDANEDGEVNLADAVLIMQALSNPSDYQLTPQGIANADVIGDDGITPMDALTIQEMGINK